MKSKLVLAMVMVCFAIMAFNSNPVMADDQVKQDILSGVEQIRQLLNNKVIPQIQGIEVPKTGQTTSYDTGDDGDLQKGKCWPNSRFTDNGDDTVTDNLTGLMWTKDANIYGMRIWSEALSGSASCTVGGYDDWRLPNIRELHGLIDFGNYNLALPADHPFDNVESYYYWSATTSAYYRGFAWVVGMCYGNVDHVFYKSSVYYVWPVRTGQ
jgi:hypothetical protein